MAPVAVFLVGVGTSGALSLSVVAYLKPYLHQILVDLCGTEPRAAFWTAFSSVTIVFTPVLFAMHDRPDPVSPMPVAFALGSQLEWAIAGLLLSVVVLGFILSRFIRLQGLQLHAHGARSV
jgi:hypothetical protein